MRTWQVSDEIRRDPAIADLVERSRSVLESVISPFSRDVVDARWDLTRAGGRPSIVLTLSEKEWPVADQRTTIDPGELASADRSRHRFLDLWADLLQAKSHEQLRRLLDESSGDAA